ncbi:MAG: hypothetical protein ACRDVN_13365 [Jiangellaceae bacterium]
MTFVLGILAVAACADDPGGARPDAGEDALAEYTDEGDGCEQTVSAIGYADTLLRALGQEDHQDFDAAVRSRLAAVAGTISLEIDDFPDGRTREQAERVGGLADRAQASEDPDAQQVLALREYRREAAQLVIDCASATGGGSESGP